ncbi:MAG: hypothetical protein A3G41_03840 [Elusimicrobia bacterium RIFCSPLOWO2_12_FULL_59_9]|nr:MAG: hypothetical protein A3G41_03840 [Elusimicrobia bacterium RIFCSPLOWO2_12_FULL_59_9]
MSNISLRLPDSLHKSIRELAHKEHVSINQMITLALAEKLSTLMTEEYLGKRAQRGNRKSFLKALGKVSNAEPETRDHLSAGPTKRFMTYENRKRYVSIHRNDCGRLHQHGGVSRVGARHHYEDHQTLNDALRYAHSTRLQIKQHSCIGPR